MGHIIEGHQITRYSGKTALLSSFCYQRLDYYCQWSTTWQILKEVLPTVLMLDLAGMHMNI